MTNESKIQNLQVTVPLGIYSGNEKDLVRAVAKILDEIAEQHIPVYEDDYECMSKTIQATIQAVQQLRFKDTEEEVISIVGNAYLFNQTKYSNESSNIDEVQA